MKKIIRFIFILTTLHIFFNTSYADRPTYNLTAMNFNFLSSNELVFDIYLLHTNPADTVFQYALGQYYFNFDTNFCAGGTITYDFAPSLPGDSSDFPFNARPRTPTRVGSQLRLNTNNAVGFGNGPIVSSVMLGSKVIRMRLRTSATSFSSNSAADLQLRWRNQNAGNPYTKIFCYLNQPAPNQEITDSTGHFITEYYPPYAIVKVIPQGYYNPNTNKLNKKDNMTFQLRSSVSPYPIQYSVIVSVDSVFFNGMFNLPYNILGLYFLTVNHKNCIETWSSSPVNFNGDNTNYDFTSSLNSAFGNNMKLVDTSPIRYGIYSGDTNQDGIIDAFDLSSVENNAIQGLTGNLVTDLTGDNYTDSEDLAIVENNSHYGVSKVVP